MPSEDFVIHAKINVFADKWNVKALELFSLYKLHQSLSGCVPSKANISKITDLVDYTWENTRAHNKGEDPDPAKSLRGLVLAYVDDIADELIQFEEFELLLRNNIDLALLEVAKLAKRPRLN